MDDFIDDSDAKIDISAEIRNIFGYDRRKFRDEVRVLKTLTESTALPFEYHQIKYYLFFDIPL